MPLQTAVMPAITSAMAQRSALDRTGFMTRMVRVIQLLCNCQLCNPAAGQTFAPITRGRALGRIAADPRLQFRDIDEGVRLAAEFVSNQRRLTRNRGHNRDADTAALYRFDK
jgi:hypothetical protein